MFLLLGDPTMRLKRTALSVLLFLFSAAPNVAQSHVVLSEVFYGGTDQGGEGGDWVELENIGNQAQDVSGWYLCSNVNYGKVGNQVILSGDDYMLQPGEVLVIEAILDIGGNRLSDTAADLGLYSSPIFADGAFMEDFIKYGDGFGFGGRQSVARDAGLWLEVDENVYDFVPVVGENQTTQYCGSGARLSTSNEFVNEIPSPGTRNSCDSSAHAFSTGFENKTLCLWSFVGGGSDC